jgi:hypothetical protein
MFLHLKLSIYYLTTSLIATYFIIINNPYLQIDLCSLTFLMRTIPNVHVVLKYREEPKLPNHDFQLNLIMKAAR